MADTISTTHVAGPSGAAQLVVPKILWSSTDEGAFVIQTLLHSASSLPDAGSEGFSKEALGKFLRSITTPADATRAQLDAASATARSVTANFLESFAALHP